MGWGGRRSHATEVQSEDSLGDGFSARRSEALGVSAIRAPATAPTTAVGGVAAASRTGRRSRSRASVAETVVADQTVTSTRSRGERAAAAATGGQPPPAPRHGRAGEHARGQDRPDHAADRDAERAVQYIRRRDPPGRSSGIQVDARKRRRKHQPQPSGRPRAPRGGVRRQRPWNERRPRARESEQAQRRRDCGERPFGRAAGQQRDRHERRRHQHQRPAGSVRGQPQRPPGRAVRTNQPIAGAPRSRPHASIAANRGCDRAGGEQMCGEPSSARGRRGRRERPGRPVGWAIGLGGRSPSCECLSVAAAQLSAPGVLGGVVRGGRGWRRAASGGVGAAWRSCVRLRLAGSRAASTAPATIPGVSPTWSSETLQRLVELVDRAPLTRSRAQREVDRRIRARAAGRGAGGAAAAGARRDGGHAIARFRCARD